MPRKLIESTQFKRDFKREARSNNATGILSELLPVLVALATDQPLDPKYRDHPLIGDKKDYRDCHVRPDAHHDQAHVIGRGKQWHVVLMPSFETWFLSGILDRVYNIKLMVDFIIIKNRCPRQKD